MSIYNSSNDEHELEVVVGRRDASPPGGGGCACSAVVPVARSPPRNPLVAAAQSPPSAAASSSPVKGSKSKRFRQQRRMSWQEWPTKYGFGTTATATADDDEYGNGIDETSLRRRHSSGGEREVMRRRDSDDYLDLMDAALHGGNDAQLDFVAFSMLAPISRSSTYDEESPSSDEAAVERATGMPRETAAAPTWQ